MSSISRTRSVLWQVVASRTVHLSYVANGTNGISILDIADARQPCLVGHFPTLEAARAVRISGARACVACDRGGLLILDVADPAAVRRIG